jgi:outer membrane protein
MIRVRALSFRIIAVLTACFGAALLGIGAACAQAQTGTETGTETGAEEFPMRIEGDVGGAGYYTRSIVRGVSERASVLPYGYFDYGRMFARIDTLGVKTIKMGYGYLELAGRVSLDGFKADSANLRGLTDRENSIPIGIGTFQITPIGAFFVNAFYDVNKSRGGLFEAIYAAELATPRVTFYPQIGAEYLSKQYAGYYYGVSAHEAAASQYSFYQPNGAFNPFLAALIDTKITDEVHLNFYFRHKWMASSIQGSPIVGRKGMDTTVVALTYRFK